MVIPVKKWAEHIILSDTSAKCPHKEGTYLLGWFQILIQVTGMGLGSDRQGEGGCPFRMGSPKRKRNSLQLDLGSV
jgi:hypothetical protein